MTQSIDIENIDDDEFLFLQVARPGRFMLCSEPPFIEFTDYREGETYETVIKIVNTSHRAVQVRMIPPSSKYFSAKLERLPGSNTLLIAPGMCCKYKVTFKPDSLGDFKSIMRVYTDSALEAEASTSSIFIPILARRKRPDLSLSRILSCECLVVDQEQTVTFACKNNGGHASFRFFESKDIQNIFELIDERIEFSTMELDTFRIEPVQFELSEGESIEIKVWFKPSSVGRHSVKVFLACSNRYVDEYMLVGEGVYPAVSLTTMDDVEFDSKTQQAVIMFDELFPYTEQTRSVTFYNDSLVPLKYHWEVLLPGSKNTLRIENARFPISVTPSSGKMHPEKHTNFAFKFIPTEVGGFSAYFLLFLDHLPVPREPTHPLYQYKDVDFTPLSDMLDNIEQRIDYANFFCTQSEVSNLIQSKSGATKRPSKTSPGLFCSMVLVNGNSKEYDVVMEPPLLLVSAPLTIFATFTKVITLNNKSNAEVAFDWNIPRNQMYEEDAPFGIDFSPSKGKLKPQSKQKITMKFVPHFTGEFAKLLLCNVGNTTLPLEFHCEVHGPMIQIGAPAVDFGVVEVGKKVNQPLSVTNVSNVRLKFSMFCASEDGLDENTAQLLFEPDTDVLEPNQSMLVTINYLPRYPQQLREVIECRVEHGHTKYISLRAEAQETKAILSTNIVDLGVTYVDCPVDCTLDIINTRFIDTSYMWYLGSLEGNETDFHVIIYPESGKLAAGDSQEIKVTFSPLKQGNYELLIPCFIQDQRDNYTGFIIRTEVRGLMISLSLPDVIQTEEDDIHSFAKFITNSCVDRAVGDEADLSFHIPELDFQEVSLMTPKTMVLSIDNLSACFTSFSLKVEKYEAKRSSQNLDETAASVTGTQITGNQKSSLLTMKGEQKSFQSLMGQTFAKEKKTKQEISSRRDEILAGSKGIAFELSKSSGRLNGNTSATVKITCYANSCGEYRDYLTLDIVGSPLLRVPIKAFVKGVPLELLPNTVGLRLPEPGQTAELLWPAVPCKSVPISKTLKVKNNLMDPLVVGWETSKDAMNPISVGLSLVGDRIQAVMKEESTEVNDTVELSDETTLLTVIPKAHSMLPGEVKEFTFSFHPKILSDNISLSVRALYYAPPITLTRNSSPAMPKIRSADYHKKYEYLEPLVIDFSCSTTPVTLSVDSKKVKYVISVDQLRASTPLLSTFGMSETQIATYVREVTLTNSTKTPLSFVLKTGKPKTFIITEIVGEADHPLTQKPLTEKKEVTATMVSQASKTPKVATVRGLPTATKKLNPRNTMKLDTSRLTLTSRTTTSNNNGLIPPTARDVLPYDENKIYYLKPYKQIKVRLLFNPAPCKPLIRNGEQISSESCITVADELVVAFSTKDTQIIPIAALIQLPVIECSTVDIDFGPVGTETKTRQLIITNKSKVCDAHWRLVQAPTGDPGIREDFSVFALDKLAGIAKASLTLAESTSVVNVVFKPKTNAQFLAQYELVTENGAHAKPLIVQLRGEGAFDEYLQKDIY